MPSIRLPMPAAAALALLSLISGARAAVKVCYPSVSSDVVAAATEIDAKRTALAAWQAKAARIGAGLDAWHVAVEKALKCYPKDAGFECVAFGQPCIIKQNPNKRPAGREQPL